MAGGSFSLNNAQELLLTKLSYLDFAKDDLDFKKNFKGRTLAQVANDLLSPTSKILSDLNLDNRKPGGLTETQFRKTLQAIANDPVVKHMSLTNYVNNGTSGSGSGYVGYALSSPDNSACVILSRGSESYPLSGTWLQDWMVTNILGIGITGYARQFSDAVDFARSSSVGYYGKNIAVGHSLGARETQS